MKKIISFILSLTLICLSSVPILASNPMSQTNSVNNKSTTLTTNLPGPAGSNHLISIIVRPAYIDQTTGHIHYYTSSSRAQTMEVSSWSEQKNCFMNISNRVLKDIPNFTGWYVEITFNKQWWGYVYPFIDGKAQPKFDCASAGTNVYKCYVSDFLSNQSRDILLTLDEDPTKGDLHLHLNKE